jgi:spermidine/putrescine transport system ATP-binding protein
MVEDSDIEITNVSRRFGETVALDGVSLTIKQGEFFSLLGPSGCGKTTLLRIIAGLEYNDEGTVCIGGEDTKDISAFQRPVNMVFQSYALFPHFNVRQNIAFGLKMKKVSQQETDERVNRVMALVEIEDLADRKPNQLSGGQRQRVALARAVVNEPKLLLLDEPLAALDLKLRKQLQVELLNLQRNLGITFIYVTHDQEEALVLSDRIAVMCDGRIEQLGDAESLYENPKTRFVSQFLGTCSLIEATVKLSDGNGMLVETALGTLRVAAKHPGRDQFTLAIRPEKIRLVSKTTQNGENECTVCIDQLIYKGSETHYDLSHGDQPLQAVAMNRHHPEHSLNLGTEATAYLPPEALIILDD